MPRRWSWYDRLSRPESDSLHKLLGELEVEIMEIMWRREVATVREVATEIADHRPVAYTTVMTVMSHLADKGLLSRAPLDKKTHLYSVALSRDEFLARSSQQMVDTLVADFGDLALAQFLEVMEHVGTEHRKRLRQLLAAMETQGETQGESQSGAEKREARDVGSAGELGTVGNSGGEGAES